jgi:hypothetical protein
MHYSAWMPIPDVRFTFKKLEFAEPFPIAISGFLTMPTSITLLLRLMPALLSMMYRLFCPCNHPRCMAFALLLVVVNGNDENRMPLLAGLRFRLALHRSGNLKARRSLKAARSSCRVA